MAPFASRFAVATLVLAPTALGLLRGGKIEPDLKDYPLSDKSGQTDKHFFGKDYPADDRIGAHKGFPHEYPFPSVQHDQKYDNDYVKDENTDSGEWQAQMDYDVSKSKIRYQESAVEAASKAEQDQLSQLTAARSAEQSAEEAAEQARSMAAQAQKAGASAEERLEQLAGKPGGEGGTGEIGSAQEHVTVELANFENCQKILQAKKANLQKLIAERDAKASAAANASVANATNASADADKEEAAVKETLKSVEEEEADVRSTEEQLAEAQKRLEEARRLHSEAARKGAGSNGLEHPPPKPTTTEAPPPPAPSAAADRKSALLHSLIAVAVMRMAF
eukprot:TRINITY_DN3301_c0_g1_i1.p1 TRINITY_DN3301_c0_g1~~TRINITY_DN3301_c0_g1_i1.p1  ORF type:complete len:335 (+),score=134.28 TRINITY_DN3301_c0_g1_i1:75-1079(+)